MYVVGLKKRDRPKVQSKDLPWELSANAYFLKGISISSINYLAGMLHYYEYMEW